MPSQKTDPSIIKNEKELIRNTAKLTDIDNIKLIDRGWDSRVYSFNDNRYFFKFPRSKKIQSRYKYEIAAMKFMNNSNLKVKAQKILWEHPENAYFGYEGVRGQPLSNLIQELDEKQKQYIGATIGEFLRYLHGLKLPDARVMHLEDESTQIQNWYEQSIATIQEWFTDKEQLKLKKLVYDVWPAKIIELGSDPVLCHGDLHFENILYDNSGSVGIIDFGDVAYKDRSIDFLELGDDEKISRSALDVYGRHHKNLESKMLVRQSMIQIINIGFHAGKDDVSNVKRTVDKIKASLY